MNLLSMTDYVLERDKVASFGGHYDRLVVYAKFLRKKIKKGLFVPCDENDIPLKKPIESEYNLGDIHAGYYSKDLQKYNDAKSNVIFKGFSIDENNNLVNGDLIISISTGHFIRQSSLGIGGGYFDKDVESLVHIGLELTDSCLLKLGLKK